MSTRPTPIAGSDIDSFCGKCQLDLAHIVIACTPGRAARVQCKTCGAQHSLRKPKAEPRKRASSKASGTPSPRSTRGKLMQAFEEAKAGKDMSSPTTFRISHTFAEGQVITHPTFGIGIVLKTNQDNKIDVLFEVTGLKVLAHARS